MTITARLATSSYLPWHSRDSRQPLVNKPPNWGGFCHYKLDSLRQIRSRQTHALLHRGPSLTLQWHLKHARGYLLVKFWIPFHFPFAKILLSFGMWAAFTTPGARRTNTVQPKELAQPKTVTRAGWKESVNDVEDCFYFNTHSRSLPSWRGLITTILSTWWWLRQLRRSKSIVRDDLANELPEIRRTLCYLVSSEDLFNVAIIGYQKIVSTPGKSPSASAM